MTSLSRGLTYIGRAFAKNSKGYAFGDIKFFTTTTTVPKSDKKPCRSGLESQVSENK